jgi:hypothetical protein
VSNAISKAAESEMNGITDSNDLNGRRLFHWRGAPTQRESMLANTLLANDDADWQGLSEAELCRALTDRNGNGNRGPAELLDHMATDKVVGTGWEGGGGRTAVQIPRKELVRLVKVWVDAGAPCPER